MNIKANLNQTKLQSKNMIILRYEYSAELKVKTQILHPDLEYTKQ